jgi:hypothetical protein
MSALLCLSETKPRRTYVLVLRTIRDAERGEGYWTGDTLLEAMDAF